MSSDGPSKEEQEAIQRFAAEVMQQLASGRTADEVARDLIDNGWPEDDAAEFVDEVEKERQRLAESPDSRVTIDIGEKFPDLRRVKSGPALGSINGCGTMLYGARDHDPETGTYVKTHVICLIFMPVFALGAYRVAKAAGEGWHLLGKVPLSAPAKTWNLLVLALIAGLAARGGWNAYTSSDAYQAARKLERADEALASGDLVAAARLYSEVASSPTEHASTAHGNLEQMVAGPELADLPLTDAVEIFHRIAGIGGVPGAFERGIEIVRKNAEAAPTDSTRLLEAIGPLSPNDARAAVAELLDGPYGNLSPADTATILRTVGKISADPAYAETLLRWGTNWLDEHPDTEPRDALALLALLAESPAADLAAIDAKQREQLERLVAAEPENHEPAVQLALLLEPEGDTDRVETLLTPHKDKLGTGEGARILGQLLAAKGAFDESYKLLGPYMEERLEELHAAQGDFDTAITRAQERAIGQLESGAAGFDYAAYDAAGEQRQEAMVREYVGLALRDDPSVAAAQERLIQHATVVPAALDLGMVILRRAEQMTDAEARQAELQKAEETFLAIQGMAGDSDAYRIHLGQVYYWLGKHEEGHRLFEELLAAHNRAYEILMGIANVLRDLGAERESRELLEQAYEKAADDDQRHAAAHFRAITQTDQEDRVVWLERCDQNVPEVKADLASARGYQASAEGDDDKAAEHFREAAAIYERMAENQSVMNNGGLIYLALFQATGDRESLEKGIEWLDKAVALAPGDPIVLFNSATSIMQAALRDLAGEELDLRRLRESGSLDILNVLATDQDRLEQLRRKVREHEGMKKALSYFDKGIVLAPKRTEQYYLALQVHAFVQDAQAMRLLSTRIDAAGLDPSESAEQLLEYLRFEDDTAAKETARASLDRMTKLVEEYLVNPAAPGFAAAVENLQGAQIILPDLSQVDPDEMVRLAEEAHTGAASLTTYSVLKAALMFRASRRLESDHPEYVEAVKGVHRSLSASYTVVLALAREDELGKSAREDPDVLRAADLVLEESEAFPGEVGPWTWALVRSTHPDRADEIAAAISEDEAGRLAQEIVLKLYPASPPVACSEYWRRLLLGDQETAPMALQQAADLGAPLPFALLDGVVEPDHNAPLSVP